MQNLFCFEVHLKLFRGTSKRIYMYLKFDLEVPQNKTPSGSFLSKPVFLLGKDADEGDWGSR